jgi:SAM-dependent methyltransferase
MSAAAPALGGSPPRRRRSGGTTPLDPDWLLQRHLHRDVRAALAASAPGRLLDLGCGERPYADDVPAGVRAIAVDVPGQSARVDVAAVASALPFGETTFETVLCTQVLEHVPDPERLVAEAARVLRPGGRLVLSAPQAWFLHEAPHDYFRFTRFGLAALCRRAGLEPIEIHAEGGFFAMAGISLAAHLGSYVRAAATGRSPRDSCAVQAHAAPWLSVLRLPLALANLLFAALDAVPHPGVFAVNHLVVAVKPAQAGRP